MSEFDPAFDFDNWEDGYDGYYHQHRLLVKQPWRKPLRENWVPGIVDLRFLEKHESGMLVWELMALRGFFKYYMATPRSWNSGWEEDRRNAAAWSIDIDIKKWQNGKVIQSVPTYERCVLPLQGVFELQVPENAGQKFFANRSWLPAGNAGDFLQFTLRQLGAQIEKTATESGMAIYHIPLYDWYEMLRRLIYLEYPILYEYGLANPESSSYPEAWDDPDTWSLPSVWTVQ
ncbi:hypothetical protein [Candidatus Tokpelaia sp.]|uniref:hypothetical protein n=1 Tax=Candidatus Tokpelaia sp. TaxID=2233777 RepID=UPI00123BA08A|nr:hypothetical protein [Candidatus Tokpelaia sp.]KAA6406007.1 hypothetical protein DPQ22_01675 [Candidatus Tokpelaia sp.]